MDFKQYAASKRKEGSLGNSDFSFAAYAKARRTLQSADATVQGVIDYINSGKGRVESKTNNTRTGVKKALYHLHGSEGPSDAITSALDTNFDGTVTEKDSSIVKKRSDAAAQDVTRYSSQIDEILSAYETIRRSAQQRGSTLEGYDESVKYLNELKTMLTVITDSNTLYGDVIKEDIETPASYDSSGSPIFENPHLTRDLYKLPQSLYNKDLYAADNPNTYAMTGGRDTSRPLLSQYLSADAKKAVDEARALDAELQKERSASIERVNSAKSELEKQFAPYFTDAEWETWQDIIKKYNFLISGTPYELDTTPLMERLSGNSAETNLPKNYKAKNDFSEYIGKLEGMKNGVPKGSNQPFSKSELDTTPLTEYLSGNSTETNLPKNYKAKNDFYEYIGELEGMQNGVPIGASQTSSKNDVFVSGLSAKEVAVISKMSSMLKAATGAKKEQSALSTVATFVGDFDNMESYQQKINENMKELQAVKDRFNPFAFGYNNGYARNPALKPLYDSMPRAAVKELVIEDTVRKQQFFMNNWRKLVTTGEDKYTKYMSAATKRQYITMSQIGPAESEKFLEDSEQEIYYNIAKENFEEAINGNWYQRATRQLNIYIASGFFTATGGIDKFFDSLDGEDTDYGFTVSEMSNQMLKQYYEDNDKHIAGLIQDVVTSATNNAVTFAGGTIIGAIARNPKLGEVIALGTMAISVFGNSYNEAKLAGYSNAQAYSIATAEAVSEIVMEKLLGAVPGVKGIVTGSLGKKVTANISNGLLRFAAKAGIRFGGESIEEGVQALLNPIMRKAILKEDIPDNYWKNAGYEAFVGGLSALLLNGANAPIEAISEKQIIEQGKTYKQFADRYGFDIKDIAKYELMVAEEGSDAYKLAQDIIDGKEKATDYNVGMLYVDAVNTMANADNDVSAEVGRFVKSEENGVEMLLKQCELKAALNTDTSGLTLIYPEEVLARAEAIRQKIDNGIEVTDYEIGKLASDVGIYAPQAAVIGAIVKDQSTNQNTNQNSQLQSTADGGIINEGGDDNVDDANIRRNDSENGEGQEEAYQAANSGTGGETYGNIGGTQKKYIEEKKSTSKANGTADRLKIVPLNGGAIIVAYITKEADNSEPYRAVEILRAKGYAVDYSDGTIESFDGKNIKQHSNAITTSTGKVIVSSTSEGPAEQIADHEEVHVCDRLNKVAYSEYQNVVLENLKLISPAYLEVAKEINEDHGFVEINEEKDISDQLLDIKVIEKINKELVAYLRQDYNRNPDSTKEKYGDIFENWDEVAAAIEKFNQETSKADPSGPANFMPENSNPDNLSQSEADMVSVAPKIKKRRHTTAKEQSYIKGVGNDLGHKVIFEDMYQTLKNMGIEPSGNIPDGYIDEEGNVHIGFTVINPTGFVLKHELTHYGEGTDGYIDYIAAMRDTKLYKQWLQAETKSDSESLGVLENLYRTKIRKSRGNMAPKGAAALNAEMYADFSGRFLFVASGFERLIKQINHKERPAAIQWVLDFFSYLIDKLSGKKNVTFELKKLESKYANMLREANKAEHTADNSGVKFSASNEAVVDESYDNIRLTDDDLYDYIRIGKRLHTRNKKEQMLESGKKPILTTPFEISQFILNVIHGNAPGEVRAYGKVGKRLARAIRAKRQNLDVIGKYIELNSDDLREAYKRHSQPKEKGDIPLTEGDFINIPKMLDDFDDVLSVNDYNGKTEIHLVKKTEDGYIRILTVSSGERNSLQVTKIIGVSKEKFENKYGNKKERDTGSLRSLTDKKTVNTNPSTTAQRTAGTLSNNNIPNPTENVKKFSVPVLEDTDTESEEDTVNVPAATRDLLDRYESGEITRDEYAEKLDEIYNTALNKYGVIPEGENAKLPLAVPKRVSDKQPVERFVRTIIETGKLSSDMLADIERDVLLGDTYSYAEVSDEKAKGKAERAVKNGTAESDWTIAVNSRAITKEDIAIGERLLLDAIENDDRIRVLELSSELADALTRAGQVVQAAKLLKQMSGIGRLITAQRNVKTINKSIIEKNGDNGNVRLVELNPLLARELAEAKTLEDAEVVYQNVLQDVAAQVPSTWLDKLNAWRYFAMLANPRTHIRNLVGNGIFGTVKTLKDVTATGLERAFIRDASKRTKAIIIDQKYKDFAAKDVKTQLVKKELAGKGQLDEKGMIDELRRTFKSDILEDLTNFNSNLLEAEDMWFKNIHYKRALAGFLQARKVDLNNVSEETLNEARSYAVKEAKKATFQDASAIADMLNNKHIPKKVKGTKGEIALMGLYYGVEGVLPFKRTPINIVKRGVEYSPLGLINSITAGLYEVRKGKITVSEYCDGLAAGLVGTGIFAVGMLLCSLGFVTGSFGNDEEDKFKQLNGEQEYSVQIFGKSYSIEWAAPACIPFFIGVELAEEIIENDGFQLKDFFEVAGNSLEPITNLSMLSGIQGVIDAVKFEDGSKTIGTIVGDVAMSFGMQMVPSVAGSVSRTIDGTKRKWYSDENSPLPDFAQSIVNNVQSKVPGLSYTQAPDIDAWGREKNRGNVGERIIENFISPGYYSSVDYSDTDEELKRLFKETGENVFPKVAKKSFNVNGETKHLTADEWVEYAKAKGERSFEYTNEFIKSSAYEKLDDNERAKVISGLYEYANAMAKAEVSEYNPSEISTYKKAVAYEKDGGSIVTYYIFKSITSEAYADFDGSGGVSKAEKRKAIKSIDADIKTKSELSKLLNRK